MKNSTINKSSPLTHCHEFTAYDENFNENLLEKINKNSPSAFALAIYFAICLENTLTQCGCNMHAASCLQNTPGKFCLIPRRCGAASWLRLFSAANIKGNFEKFASHLIPRLLININYNLKIYDIIPNNIGQYQL